MGAPYPQGCLSCPLSYQSPDQGYLIPSLKTRGLSTCTCTSPTPCPQPLEGCMVAGCRGGQRGEQGPCLCAERGAPGPGEGEQVGDRTEPMAGDIGCRGASCSPGLGGDPHGPGRAAVMRRNFPPLCPGLHNELGMPPGLQMPLQRAESTHPGLWGPHQPRSHVLFLPLVFCVFCLQPYKDKEALFALTNTGSARVGPRARTCHLCLDKGHACS